MSSFEEWYADYDDKEEYLQGMRDAYNAGRADEKFAANNRAGDSANEAEKDARRKIAVDYILHECDSFGPCLPREKLDAIIKEAQG